MDIDYWKKYYEKEPVPHEASLFAQVVLREHLRKGHSVIELGCGNGRDCIYFAKHGINIIAIDQCHNTIETLKERNNHTNIKFIVGDFTKLGKMDQVDHVYSRFTMHSISEEDEDRVTAWAYDHLKNNGKLHIEARGKKNELYRVGKPVPGHPNAYIHDDHYRRFIDIDVLHKKLEDVGFSVLVKEEKTGFAPFKDTDQVFIRIIATKTDKRNKHNKHD